MINGILLNSRPVLLVPAALSRVQVEQLPYYVHEAEFKTKTPHPHPPTASNTAFLGQNCADRALFK